MPHIAKFGDAVVAKWSRSRRDWNRERNQKRLVLLMSSRFSLEMRSFLYSHPHLLPEAPHLQIAGYVTLLKENQFRIASLYAFGYRSAVGVFSRIIWVTSVMFLPTES